LRCPGHAGSCRAMPFLRGKGALIAALDQELQGYSIAGTKTACGEVPGV